MIQVSQKITRFFPPHFVRWGSAGGLLMGEGGGTVFKFNYESKVDQFVRPECARELYLVEIERRSKMILK